jgi:hypothetical protein
MALMEATALRSMQGTWTWTKPPGGADFALAADLGAGDGGVLLEHDPDGASRRGDGSYEAARKLSHARAACRAWTIHFGEWG